MGETAGMIRPDLQALPQIRERMTFIYLEHTKLNREDGAITASDERGTVCFPAYAGVIPHSPSRQVAKRTFPRIRGGDPDSQNTAYRLLTFSPHTRG